MAADRCSSCDRIIEVGSCNGNYDNKGNFRCGFCLETKFNSEDSQMDLRDDRKINNIDEINSKLSELLEMKINDLDDDEFLDFIYGNRGNFSFCGGNGSFKLTESACKLGNKENLPCQWLDIYCSGYHCKHIQVGKVKV